MEEEIYSKIITKESAEILAKELNLVLNSLYLGSREFTSVLKTKVRASLSEYIKAKINQESTDIEKLLKNMIERIKLIPSVRLVLAYEPSEDALDKFHSIITSACKKPILLDVVYSPDIIGGAIIIYQGRYRDYSFKYLFEKEFEKEKENIMKLL